MQQHIPPKAPFHRLSSRTTSFASSLIATFSSNVSATTVMPSMHLVSSVSPMSVPLMPGLLIVMQTRAFFHVTRSLLCVSHLSHIEPCCKYIRKGIVKNLVSQIPNELPLLGLYVLLKIIGNVLEQNKQHVYAFTAPFSQACGKSGHCSKVNCGVDGIRADIFDDIE